MHTDVIAALWRNLRCLFILVSCHHVSLSFLFHQCVGLPEIEGIVTDVRYNYFLRYIGRRLKGLKFYFTYARICFFTSIWAYFRSRFSTLSPIYRCNYLLNNKRQYKYWPYPNSMGFIKGNRTTWFKPIDTSMDPSNELWFDANDWW